MGWLSNGDVPGNMGNEQDTCSWMVPVYENCVRGIKEQGDTRKLPGFIPIPSARCSFVHLRAQNKSASIEFSTRRSSRQ